MPAEIAHGNFTTLFEWLGKNIHSRASSVDSSTLLKDATGEDINPEFYLKHVRERYL